MDNNFNIWYETYDPDYLDINIKSRVPDVWMRWDTIADDHSDSIIKPLNQYLDYMCPPPELVSIEGNTIILQQNSYAEIMIDNTKDDFFSIEKVWLREYYKSRYPVADKIENFPDGFTYFMPWIIDEDVSVKIDSIDGSPFSVVAKQFAFKKIIGTPEYISPVPINFSFKRAGKHMKVENSWGIIRKGTPVYSMTMVVDDIIVQRVKDFYEKKEQ
jgi:hypothetical protein